MSAADVNDGIERSDAAKCVRAQTQRKHGALHEIDVGIQSLGLDKHSCRQIKAKNVHPSVKKIACNVSGTATDIADRSGRAYIVGKMIEQLTVERLIFEFRVDAIGIFSGDGVVAYPYFFGLRVGPPGIGIHGSHSS